METELNIAEYIKDIGITEDFLLSNGLSKKETIEFISELKSMSVDDINEEKRNMSTKTLSCGDLIRKDGQEFQVLIFPNGKISIYGVFTGDINNRISANKDLIKEDISDCQFQTKYGLTNGEVNYGTFEEFVPFKFSRYIYHMVKSYYNIE